MIVLAWLALALTPAPKSAGHAPAGLGNFAKQGRLEAPDLKEASGIVASRRHPGIFWVHNDSGNPPALFAVHRDGSLVREFAVAAPNIDWEDIALDDQGRLYLGDIGNNKTVLPVRVIHRLDEPNPASPDTAPLRVKASFHYDFLPGRTPFDAESLVIDNDRALLIAKNRDGRPAELFALPLNVPAPLFRPIHPKLLGTLPGFNEPATGADLSADGSRLAVCGTRDARVYQRAGDAWKLLGETHFPAKQVEGIAWDGPNLILVDESRDVFGINPTTPHAP